MTPMLGSKKPPAAIVLVRVVQIGSLCAAIAGSLLKRVPSYRKTPENSSGARVTVARVAAEPAEKPPTTGFPPSGSKARISDTAKRASAEAALLSQPAMALQSTPDSQERAVWFVRSSSTSHTSYPAWASSPAAEFLYSPVSLIS